MRSCCFSSALQATFRQLVPAALAVIALTGCREVSEPPPKAVAQAPRAEDVLRRMVSNYQTAETYADQGVLRLRYNERGDIRVDEAPFLVSMQRPNRLRVHAYHTTVVCDGERLFAQVADEATLNIDGQVLARAAPGTMSLAELYSDRVLRDAITSGLGRQPPQLDLLYGERPLEPLFQATASARLLPSQPFESRPCHRVEATTAEGPFVFWIDQADFALRKLEYPVRSFAAELAQSDEVFDLQLVAEFSAAKLNSKLAQASFQFTIPPDAKPVATFVLPPQALPSNLFGQRPSDFSFVDLQGERINGDAFSGTVTVLMWFYEHPACRASLEQLSRVYQARYRGERRIAVHAVCTEPTTRSHEDIQRCVQSWGVELPLLRDLDACGRDVFQIKGAPTLVVLDAKGTVQIVEVGANPHLAEQLPTVLDRLLAGDDLAEEIVARHRQQAVQYAHDIAAAQQAHSSPSSTVLPPQSAGNWVPVEP